MDLLDANILLEVLVSGRLRADKVSHWMENAKKPYCICMLTVHLVLHFGLKEGLGLPTLKKFLADYPIESLTADDYFNATELLHDNDHEDALQLAAAKRIGCKRIVTLDAKFAATYKNQFDFLVIS